MQAADQIDSSTLAALLESLGGDADFLKELVDAYLDSTPGLLAELRQAAAAGNPAALQRAAHSLKTGSANMGAHGLAALCKEMEGIGKSGVLDGADARIDRLTAAFEDVARALADRAWML